MKFVRAFILLLVSIMTIHVEANEPKVLTEWIPFEIHRNHIAIETQIKGQQIKAVLDTGATVSAISKNTAKALGLRRSK
ncbi:MAG: retroviral-like aspartic protease family protein, partial [Kangiellaceae bacterium]|nr:retroviral-like aspartic protease family protein [Kangiellaceae bacterium]